MRNQASSPCRWAAILSLFALMTGAPTFAVAASPPATELIHPLDALSAEEISRTLDILKSAARLRPDAKVVSISLLEPPKQEVLNWKKGAPYPRGATVTILQERKTFKGTVDLRSGQVKSWQEIKDAQASFLLGEVMGATSIVVADPAWQAAMRKRGITDFSTVMCNPLSVGFVPDKERQTRLMNVPCFDVRGVGNNGFARPVEGLMALVDLNDRKVVRLIDLGVVPVPPEMPLYDYASVKKHRRPLKPVEMAARIGENFKVNGGEISWDNWSFHVRPDRRSGLILSLIKWDDHGQPRSVAYQLAASEMFVPYMDPTPTWSFKSYLDAGEYGLGLLASPLSPGRDCPSSAKFLNGTLHDDDGKPLTMPGVICIFERNAGDPAWRHSDLVQSTESRPEVDLVVRSIAVIGNYDYILDYVFTQKGELVVRVGATGIDAVKGVKSRTIKDPSAAEDTAFGSLIGPGVVGINHDHYVNFRLDLDIDGPTNTFMVDHLALKEAPPQSARRSYWQVESQAQATEGPIEAHGHDSMFRLISSNKTNAYGYNTGYNLMLGHTTASLLSADDPIQGRAMFAKHPLWLSRYDSNELFGAGEFANQSPPGEGLPRYTKEKGSAVNTDLVLWYTVGFRHVTRAEDWPIMPTLWHEFRLRPFNFFDRNPALDLSPDFEKAE